MADDWQSDVVFTHALALTLDDAAQDWLAELHGELVAEGIPVLHQPAHLTLACVDTLDGVADAVKELVWPTRLSLGAACLLPDSDGVVAACPHGLGEGDVPEELESPHRLLHSRLAALGVTTFNYYAPPRWHPHVTVAYQAGAEQRRRAAQLVAGRLPVVLGISAVSAWDVARDEVTLLAPASAGRETTESVMATR